MAFTDNYADFNNRFTLVGKTIKIFDQLSRFAWVTATNNFLDLEASTQTVLGPEPVQTAVASAQANTRSLVDQALRSAAAAILPHIYDLMRAVQDAGTLGAGPVESLSTERLLVELYRYMDSASVSIKGRNVRYNPITAAGGNLGNGTIVRHTTDSTATKRIMENCHLETMTVICRADQNTGTRPGREKFEFIGSRYVDELERELTAAEHGIRRGSGVRKTVECLSADSSRIVKNPSFSQYGGTTDAPTDITGWTSSVTVNGTNYSIDTTNYYVESDVEGGVPASLNMKVTATVRQYILDNAGALDRSKPYVLRLAYNTGPGTASGSLSLFAGALSTSATLTSLGSGWNNLTLTFWPDEATASGLSFGATFTRTAGQLRIDNMIGPVPLTEIDGDYAAPVTGSERFIVDDEFSYTKTASAFAGQGIIQRWMWRAFKFFLPYKTDGTQTIADPT